MGSRARIAAAACLVASGLLIGGAGTATAVADPGSSTNDDSAESPAERPARPEGTSKRSAERGEVQPGADTPDPEPGIDDPKEDPPTKGEEHGEDDEGEDGEQKPRPPCCDEGEEDCGPGWPWPLPDPPTPDDPLTEDNDSDRRPVGVPPSLPQGPLVGGPARPDVIDIIPGLDVGDSDLQTAPIGVPVVAPAPPLTISPALAPGPAVGPPASAGAPAALPVSPRQVSTSPAPARQPSPAAAGSSVTIPTAGSRVGYADYLRSAGISQIAVLALPGLAGILLLTGAGGLVGYRQAKAGQGVRSRGIARFMN